MAHQIDESKPKYLSQTRFMSGRRIIKTSVTEITDENVVDVLRKALATHDLNRSEIDYLWKYYRGDQPIRNRVKDVRPEICNKITENRANEIVSFKVGYLCGEPIQYVSRNGGEEIVKQINTLNSLVGTAGMKRKINVYKATAGTEKLKMGEGNTKSIEVSFTPEEYEIQLAQNKFQYYDEQEMTDPMLVPVGTRHMGTDMFNTVNGDVYGEFKKATMVVPTAKIDFAAFVDAVANLNIESTDNQPEKVAPQTFAFVHPGDTAELRKNLAEDLKYVEAFARAGYIGTVGGVNIYTKKDATKGTIVVATRQAVTIFNKKGVEVETDRNGDIRQNTIWSRKYYLAALTDATKAVKIFKGTATATADTTVSEGKVYYAKTDSGYIVGKPKTNPKTEGFYEIA